jgi:dTDP-4-amino-4,6-dideoxygalactose transaminase
MSYPTWPNYAADEIAAVTKVLQSGRVNYWTGNEGKLFEQEFANFIGCPYAVALANGTVALELALRALAIGPGDDVIVPCRTFIASASCVIACGAKPIVADVDQNSQNITVATIKQALTPNTKAIIAVHLAGWPCAMDEILAFAKQHGLKVIEDCAQAHGAKYKNQYVGSFGDVAAFSFCQDKIITTGGEGGMLVTKNKDIWNKAWSYKDHGKDYAAVNADNPNAVFRLVHRSFGTNWRMTEMQAAIGRIQLRKLAEWLAIRRRNAAILTEHFKHIPGLRVPIPPEQYAHAYYQYYAFINKELLKEGWHRDKIIQELRDIGVPCFSGSSPEIYLEQAFQNAGLTPKQHFKTAKQLGETSLVFLVHPQLTEDDMPEMARGIGKIMQDAA